MTALDRLARRDLAFEVVCPVGMFIHMDQKHLGRANDSYDFAAKIASRYLAYLGIV